MTFARILGITVATSVIVFLGLTFLLPRHHDEHTTTASITPDQVFGSQATPPAPGETPAATPAETTSASASAGSTPAASAPAEPATAPAPTPAPAATPAAADSGSAAPAASQGLSDEEARKIAEDVGRKVATRVVEEKAPPAEAAAPAPAASEPAATSSGSGTSLTEADVRRIAAEEARRVLAESGGGVAVSGKKSHAHAAPAPADAPASAPAADSPSADASTPAPAPAEPKHTHAAATKTPGHGHGGRSKSLPGDLPASDAISSWWPPSDKQSADHLNLVYAGEAAFEKAVVLLFSNPVDAASASSHLQLYGSDGKPAAGGWESSSSNPRMLLFKGVKPGRYTVIVAPELADTSGKTIAGGLHGPVYVH